VRDVGALGNRRPLVAQLRALQVECPATVSVGLILQVHGILQRRRALSCAPFEVKVVIAAGTENQLEVLLAEPVVQLFHVTRRGVESQGSITAVDEDVAAEYPQFLVAGMGVADDHDLHWKRMRRLGMRTGKCWAKALRISSLQATRTPPGLALRRVSLYFPFQAGNWVREQGSLMTRSSATFSPLRIRGPNTAVVSAE